MTNYFSYLSFLTDVVNKQFEISRKIDDLQLNHSHLSYQLCYEMDEEKRKLMLTALKDIEKKIVRCQKALKKISKLSKKIQKRHKKEVI